MSDINISELSNLSNRGPRTHTIAPVMMKNGHAENRPAAPYWFVQNQNGDLCGVRCDTPSYSCVNRVRLDEDGTWWLTPDATANLSSEQITALLTTGVCDWQESWNAGRIVDRRCRIIDQAEADEIWAVRTVW
jgi:hypothetical protein